MQDKYIFIDYFKSGIKAPDNLKIGTEHEKFIYQNEDFKPIRYNGERSIQTIFTYFIENYGYQAIYDNENIIGLYKDDLSISLEPAGQFELSGGIRSNIHETNKETNNHFTELHKILKKLNLSCLFMGVAPFWTLSELDKVPKSRYTIMRKYMQKTGKLGLDMMHRTTTIQTNIDYTSEEDMARKLRIGFAIQPFILSLFANSPIKEGAITPYKSYRNFIWTDTDNDRAGIIKDVFHENFTFEKYLDFVFRVPMYFIKRGEKYYDVAGRSFKEYFTSGFSDLPELKFEMIDFEDHLSTIFTEVRLKKFIELRSIDGNKEPFITALSALWCGLLYDKKSYEAIYDFAMNINYDDAKLLYKLAYCNALDSEYKNKKFSFYANEILNIAQDGLRRRNIIENGNDESIYLRPLFDVCLSKKSNADLNIEIYKNSSADDIEKKIYNLNSN